MRREVTLGGFSPAALLAQLKQRGIRLNSLAPTLLAHPAFATRAAAVRVCTVETSALELGHPAGATTAQLHASAADRGLVPGPLELAVHLRLQTDDPPQARDALQEGAPGAPAGALTVAAPPVWTDDGRLLGFYLRRIDGALWLRGYRAPPEHRWRSADRFVYCVAP